MSENEISYKIIGAALEVHKAVGPGLLESVYETLLAYELRQQDLEVKTQVKMPLIYKAVKMETAFRLDMVVENKVVVELKTVDMITKVHYAQVLTYLNLSGLKLALLMNFNSVLLKEGIHRVVNKL